MPARVERVFIYYTDAKQADEVLDFPIWWDRREFFNLFGDRQVDTGNPIYVDYSYQLTAAEAQHRLEAFIGRAHQAGRRCVLVVTGKGSVTTGGGVLRRCLPDWLNGPVCRTKILAFCPAQPADGGAGAFYVLLRKKKGSGAGPGTTRSRGVEP